LVVPPDVVGAVTGVVPLLVPASLPPRTDDRGVPSRAGGRPLPLPSLVARRARTTVYGLAGVDDRGRVADRNLIRALGWTCATRLDMRVAAGRVVITAVPDGARGLAGRDRLPLPAHLRRGCGIEPGDRVLLAAEPAHGVLTIHPTASLDAMLNALPSPAPRGDAA
jgi:hypothetical protein